MRLWASFKPQEGTSKVLPHLGFNTRNSKELSVGGRVSDPAFRVLEINVNLQEMGPRFPRTHPPAPSLTTSIQLLSHITIPRPKFQHFLLHPA